MAAKRRTADRANSYRRGDDPRSMYVYGNTAAMPEYAPERREEPVQRPKRKQTRRQSRQVRQNRRRELRVGKRYVIFLTAAAMITLFICVNYVRLQSDIAGRSSHITALQEELAGMREENTAKYNSIIDSVTMDEVKARALQLGMVEDSGQTVEYDSPEGNYVKQYEDIPENGIISGSDQVQD